MLIEVIWVIVMLAAGAVWMRRDMAEFRRFVRIKDSLLRQRTYGRWIATTFAFFTFASFVSLWLAGGLVPFDPFPQAFDQANAMLKLPDRPVTPEMLFGMAIGVSINVAIFVLVQQWRDKKSVRDKDDQSPNDVDALIPRNGREALYGIALSINAGFSEELFFRLALPLLMLHITGSLPFAFVFAALCFGLAHAYQGVRGVLATMFAGGILTLVYLRTGSLLHVMLLHGAIDIVALFVRPWARRVLSPKSAAPLASHHKSEADAA